MDHFISPISRSNTHDQHFMLLMTSLCAIASNFFFKKNSRLRPVLQLLIISPWCMTMYLLSHWTVKIYSHALNELIDFSSSRCGVITAAGELIFQLSLWSSGNRCQSKLAMRNQHFTVIHIFLCPGKCMPTIVCANPLYFEMKIWLKMSEISTLKSVFM